MAQVRGLGPRVSDRLALLCIHRMKRVYSVLVDFMGMLWRLINCLSLSLLLLLSTSTMY